LGIDIDVDWSDIRVICLAPEYKKYDLHAVQVMGANIELWQYKFYENGILSIDEVYKRINTGSHQETEDFNGKNPIMVEAGKKAALTRKQQLTHWSNTLRTLMIIYLNYLTP